MPRPILKNRVQLDKMRAAGQLAAQTLDMITPHVQAGISTLELDRLCHEYILAHNATPAPLNYRGFPKSICTSINDVVCHGIPAAEDVLQDGDIINIDVTVILDGWHGDSSRMFTVGQVASAAQKLVDDTHTAMMKGIATVQSGSWLSDIGQAIQTFADEQGYSVVQDYCGHGIGAKFHEQPMVLHYHPYPAGCDVRIRKGMVFTVEPMLNLGTYACEVMKDDWTVRTQDRKLSAQWEHTLAVTDDGYEILTQSG